ncbi:MAG: hypothetical protein IAG13_15190, partial [Deltaproteobacteria bacterium]|nr:hypothetical protein [Nannocystaceae bacterium]
MRYRPALGPIIALAVLGGCQESPSFRLRWKLIDRPPADREEEPADEKERLAGVEIKRAIDCSELGINTVRVTTIDDLGQIADQRYFPCYLPRFAERDGADVGGPNLGDGRYAIEVRGVQRDGVEWIASTSVPSDPARRCDPDLDEPVCRPEDIACDCHDLDLPDDTDDWPHTFLLAAPAECIDGVDNDRDGLVDAQEGGCRLDPGRPESDNVGAVQ